jgi:GxxExxY protein
MSVQALTREPQINHITGLIITAAMKVHSALGPGLLESAYHACLMHELRKQGVHVTSEVAVPVEYDGVTLDVGYRMDLVVENMVVVELKCVEAFSPIHEAQLLSYLKLTGFQVGLLINFHVVHLRDGIKRMVRRTEWHKN